MKKHNFYAGPSVLPQSAIDETINALKDFAGTGLSLASISHRSKEFDAVMNEAVALFKELLNIPEGYSVLFLGGGASMQFAMIPFNFMRNKAMYINTGTWASKAIKEAKIFGEVVEIKNDDFMSIPKDYKVTDDLDYVHITTNNTIYGTEYHEDLDFGKTLLIADMSSDIFSRPVDISKYALIYGGAQKNLAPSGVTFVIVKDELLGRMDRKIPSMLDYKTHTTKNSMFNTPPVIPVFTALQTLKWIKAKGGVNAINAMSHEKATMLYNEIDRNPLFVGTVAKEDRSIMNICFVMNKGHEALEADFMKYATERGMLGIKGHRSVGGFRASTYNSLPKESVEALILAMKEFEENNK